MKYVLGLGFVVHKFRKNPKVRIFVDDLFIDEYEIDKHDPVENTLAINRLNYWFPDWQAQPPWPSLVKIRNNGDKTLLSNIPYKDPWPRQWKTYVLDDTTLENKTHIKLEIYNDDSDYTNGFMNRSTIVDMRHVFLLPVDLLDCYCSNAGEFFAGLRKVLPPKYKGVVEVHKNMGEIVGYIGYPFPFKYKWHGVSNKTSMESIGGSGLMSLDLCEKKGVIMFDPHDEQFTHFMSLDRGAFGDKQFNFKSMMQSYGLNNDEIDQYLESYKEKTEIPAFPISEAFFTLPPRLLEHKYT
jgi:hypothetical protein